MSKAILVIELPEYRIGREQSIFLDNVKLKPMPCKSYSFEHRYADGKVIGKVIYQTEFNRGWNACIDEILGEKNEQ